MTVSKSKPLLSWEEFDAMEYGECRLYITGQDDLGIRAWLETKGFKSEPKGDKDMYAIYVEYYKLEHSPLGQALK